MIAPLEAPAHCRADRFLAWAATLDESTAAPPRRRRAAAIALDPLRRRRAARIADGSPLRLQLGCDSSYADGWIAADRTDGKRLAFRWDLSRPLPLRPASVDSICHEHLLERFSYAQGVELHRRCLAVLQPGGVLRIGVVNAGAALQGYAMTGAGDAGQWPTAMARVAALTHDPSCRSIYDAETLELSCLAAGFPRVNQRAFGEGELQPSPDSREQGDQTLYVEAIA